MIINKVSVTKEIKRKAFDSSKRFKEGKYPYVESHRGCNRVEPENTLAAFQKAIDIGCDSVELDIWLTKDKIPVVIHGKQNGEIDETTNGTGTVNELTFSEISNFFTNNNLPIPTLEDVILLCRNRIFMNIEIKDTNFSECFEKTISLIIYYDIKDQVAISSFSHQYWEEIKKYKDSSFEFGFLYDTSEGQQAEFSFDPERKDNTINVWYKEINYEFVNKAHQSGIAVHCWFTLTDEETEDVFKFLFSCGVDVVCANCPEVALKTRKEMFGI